MNESIKTITEQLGEIAKEFCNKYCRYPYMDIPKGKSEDWLVIDQDSPCNDCPINKIGE